MSNIIKPDEQRELNSLNNSYIQNMGAFNRLEDRTPYDGMIDRFGDTRLRLAVVDNPEINRNQSQPTDPLNTKNVINHNSGKITLKWLDTPGGVIRPSETGGEWNYIRNNDKYNPEEREYNEWDIKSRREQVSLSHPFIWTDNVNYCGFNYLPPVGSIVVVGFRKHGFPIILGYISTHYKICYPVLKPGELVMKGYGNNYTHWRWSDKVDIKAWSEENKNDIDDPDIREQKDGTPKKNPTSCTLWLRLDANNRFIEMSATEVDSDPNNGSWDKHNKNPEAPHGTHRTKLILKPRNLIIESNEIPSGSWNDSTHMQMRSTKYYQDENCIETIATNPLTQHNTSIYQDASLIKTMSSNSKESTTTNITPSSYVINTGEFKVNAKNSSINSSNKNVFISGADTVFNVGGQETHTTNKTEFNSGSEHSIKAGIIKLN